MLGEELKTSLEACPSAVLVVDAVGTIAFANAEARRLFLTDGDVSGLPAKRFLLDWPLPPQILQYRIANARGNETLARVKAARWQVASGIMTTLYIEPERDRNLPATSEADIRLRSVIEMLPQAVSVFDAGGPVCPLERKIC